HHITLASEQ
ncbi:hypothetical protein EC100833_1952, partial [Escherichia coli 10.0833]